RFGFLMRTWASQLGHGTLNVGMEGPRGVTGRNTDDEVATADDGARAILAGRVCGVQRVFAADRRRRPGRRRISGPGTRIHWVRAPSPVPSLRSGPTPLASLLPPRGGGSRDARGVGEPRSGRRVRGSCPDPPPGNGTRD